VNVRVNTPPAADAGEDQTVPGGAGVTLDGSGSTDADGGALLYSWVQTDGPTVTLTGASTAAPTFTAPSDPAVLTFELTVTDDGGLTDTDAVVVTARGSGTGPGDAPRLTITMDRRCLGNGGATIGLLLRPTAPTTYDVASSNRGLLPPSRVRVDARAGGDVRVELRPVGSRSGVALVTLTATNAAGSSQVVFRVVVGTDGPDRLRGSGRTDVVLARGGDDVSGGRAGGDLLCGGPGDDRLRGGLGPDVLRGQGGDDRLRGGPEDVLDGGPGSTEVFPWRLRLPAF